MKLFKKYGWVVAVLALVAFSGSAYAQSVTITEYASVKYKKIKFAWVSDGSGDVDSSSIGKTTKAYAGEILAIATAPIAAASPDDNYDITLLDDDGFDVLLGQGANKDEILTEYVAEGKLGAVNGARIRIVIANAGATKQGWLTIWIKET